MKTENNLGNKAAFFAQYWGQIAIDHNGSVNIWNGLTDLGGWYLELTPLSQISEEHAVTAMMLSLNEKACDFKGDRQEAIAWYLLNMPDNQKECDYLRSKGYAVPWRDLSVDDLVGYGWVKLKTE